MGSRVRALERTRHHADLTGAGAHVYGLSSQTSDYQSEAASRLHLLSDAALQLAQKLGLPTFTVDDLVLYKRLTLIVRAARIEHVFYPVFPPDRHAEEVLAWLREHPVETH